MKTVENLMDENIRLGNVIEDFSRRITESKEAGDELYEVYMMLIRIHSKRHDEIVAML